ncbi:hypothetical protein LZ32DRAFT_295365 [Colletotrichum eremochloae]|nr:hypothetical protein LZ32DRAFT_295365 [Colletotrichum eremochloae]
MADSINQSLAPRSVCLCRLSTPTRTHAHTHTHTHTQKHSSSTRPPPPQRITAGPERPGWNGGRETRPAVWKGRILGLAELATIAKEKRHAWGEGGEGSDGRVETVGHLPYTTRRRGSNGSSVSDRAYSAAAAGDGRHATRKRKRKTEKG